jgi:Protein kinase domain
MIDPGSTQPHVPTESASSLPRILDDYRKELATGCVPDKEGLLQQHPELADVLNSCLATVDFIHRGQLPSGEPTQLGDFRIVAEIGRGAMGVVYEAEQLSLHRRVALKILRYGGPVDPEALARFRREAETVAQLHHTHIAPVFAIGCEQGVHYYAMQIIEGRSLAALIGGALPSPRQVADWGLQIAEALAYAHAHGVIHRDVKPSNLLLDKAGSVWLTDFGLARRTEETALTAAGVPLGTPRYMSPEQVAAAQPVDHRSDVYSLGATLYELLTGQPAFDADSVPVLFARIQEAEPVPPRRLRTDCPRDLETILLKCLAKEARRRYATAQDLANDLRAVTEDRAIKARRPGLVERSERWLAGRRFTPLGMTVVFLAVVLVLGLVGRLAWVRWRASVDRNTAALSLTVTGQMERLTAEILSGDRDEWVLPPFAVPTASPVRLPAGSYRLVLSRPGWLSPTYPLVLLPSRDELQVQLFDRWPPPPTSGSPSRRLPLVRPHTWSAPVERALLCETVPASSGQGLDVVVLKEARQAGGALALQRLEGTTGRVQWQQLLGEDKAGPLSPGRDWERYFPSLRFPGSPSAEEQRRLRHVVGFPTRENTPWLSVQGPNLLLASRTTGSVLAVSAATGDQVWVQGDPHPREQPFPVGGIPRPPLLFEQDGQPRLVALLWKSGRHGNKGVGLALRCLAGQNGQELWSAQLPDAPLEEIGQFHPKPALVRLGQRDVVVCIVGKQLLRFDARTGQALPVHLLPFDLVHPPGYADLDGDGNADALLLHEDRANRLTLTAFDLARDQPLWEADWPGAPDLSMGVPEWARKTPADWPLVVDLGSGLDVVVRQTEFLPGQQPIRSNGAPHAPEDSVERVSVLVLDGRTGRKRWGRQLARSNSMSFRRFSSMRLLGGAGGDGRPQLFVASVLSPWTGNRLDPLPEFLGGGDSWRPPLDLYIDALSGADGRSVWWQRRRLTAPQWYGQLSGEGLGPLRWLPAAKGDASRLLVSWQDQLSVEQATSYSGVRVLASDTGKLLHTVPFLEQPLAVDLDGDGRPELTGWTVERETGVNGTVRSSSWQPIRGTALTDAADAQQWQREQLLELQRVWASNGFSSPSIEGAGMPEDPRQVVPLPWQRDREVGDMLTRDTEEFVTSMLLWTVPPMLLFVPASVWGRAWQFRRLRRRGLSEEAIKTWGWTGWRRLTLGWALLALVLLVVGVVWIACDQTSLAPNERYRWDRWYLMPLGPWLLVQLACMVPISYLVDLWWRTAKPPRASAPKASGK